MKAEHVLVFVAGLLVLAYVLDAIVNPLRLQLPTPYHFFDPEIMFKYSFTSSTIIIKTIALTTVTIYAVSVLKLSKVLTGGAVLLISGLMQLYALQDVATNSQVIPLEWSLALTMTGMLLLIPAILYFVIGLIGNAHKSLTNDPNFVPDESEEGNKS